MKNVMIDIETMGNQSYSSIISIGAVRFDIETGEKGPSFYTTVDFQSCLDLGLIVNADTIQWWLTQNREAMEKAFKPGLTITHALNLLYSFLKKDDIVWGNSARFDLGILQNAYNKAGIPIPWDFRNERCVRTLLSLNPDVKKNIEFKGITHDPIADCEYQIEYCCEIYKSLKNGN